MAVIGYNGAVNHLASTMSDWVFVRRVLIVFGLAALAAALWALSDILLMVFGCSGRPRLACVG